MIYPDWDVDSWCKKHGLAVTEIRCPNCGLIQETTIPFIAKECVGLVAPVHGCGPDWQAGLVASRDPDTRQRWADFVVDSTS